MPALRAQSDGLFAEPEGSKSFTPTAKGKGEALPKSISAEQLGRDEARALVEAGYMPAWRYIALFGFEGG